VPDGREVDTRLVHPRLTVGAKDSVNGSVFDPDLMARVRQPDAAIAKAGRTLVRAERHRRLQVVPVVFIVLAMWPAASAE